VSVILATRGARVRGCGSGYKWFAIAYGQRPKVTMKTEMQREGRCEYVVGVTDGVPYSRGRTQAQAQGIGNDET
jgi:hypothetical protein